MGTINTHLLGSLMAEMQRTSAFNIIERVQKPLDIDTFMQEIVIVGKTQTKDFTLDRYNTFAYDNIARWLHGQPFKCLDPVTRAVVEGSPRKGIYIAGGTGTGKSLSLRIMNYLSRLHGFTLEFTGNRSSKSLEWDEYHATAIAEKVLKTGDTKDINSSVVLCIQDLGTEPAEAVYMGNRLDPMTMLLEKRGDMTDRMTLITSNYPMAHEFISERYGSRAASRLREMCNYFEMTGDDRRK